MFLAGAANLNSKKDYINELNVFPVPDGDTGSNMTLTILSAVSEVEALPNNFTMDMLCKAISSGSLKGARGNSGVILSQILRGLTKSFKEHNEIDTNHTAVAFKSAVESAFKAVMKPKEGTILTVAKAISDEASNIANEVTDIEEFLVKVAAAGQKALDNTPNQLPILKEAGVVDSGGMGLMTVLYGALYKLQGKEIALLSTDDGVKRQRGAGVMSGNGPRKGKGSSYDADITFTYCTEFIVMLDKELEDKEREAFKEYLLGLGDSLVFVYDDDYIKIHVHTDHPGKAFEKGIEFGQLTNMKIDNMREEHQEAKEHAQSVKASLDLDMDLSPEALAEAKAHDEAKAKEEFAKLKKSDIVDMPHKDMGIIAVSIGKGMNDIFNGLGVDYLVEGGQTMNPSTEDMLSAINHVNADNIFIFPNNKNIIMAANQARDLTEDKNIVIIPTTTVPQGVSAIICFNPEGDVTENEETFKGVIANVKTGQVTYAVRDTKINGVEVHKEDIMGMDDSGIQAVGKDIEATTIELIEKMVDSDSELISIYKGAEVSSKDADDLLSKISEKFPECDVDMNDGGQPVYYYILSVE
ncbi:MAG: DAK2 domain-containing protein [Lachnospiraceae bacterium]|nr:DAK2 domain-containing protein [Lachnospiraceae bacterium]